MAESITLAKHLEHSLIGQRVRVWNDCCAASGVQSKTPPSLEGFVRAVDGITLLVHNEIANAWFVRDELVAVDAKFGGVLVIDAADVWGR